MIIQNPEDSTVITEHNINGMNQIFMHLYYITTMGKAL